jgi:predicted esterase YcpF (UPF0227 family)
MAVVGSSLGGFYATWVAQQTGCRAVLLNPAVDPARDLAAHIGEQTAWHDPGRALLLRTRLRGRAARAADAGPLPRPSAFRRHRQGRRVLDWREMTGRYPAPGSSCWPAGDHALSDFDDHLDVLASFSFLGLR